MSAGAENPYAAPQSLAAGPSRPRPWSPPQGPFTTGIRMSGEARWSDLRRAVRLHRRGRVRRWVLWLYLLGLGTVISLVSDGAVHHWAWFVALAMVILFECLLLWQLRFLHRNWREGGLEGRPFERIFCADGIQNNSPDASQTMRWTFLSKYRASDDMVLLYWNPPPTFWYCPRECFASEADWRAFIDLLREHLPSE